MVMKGRMALGISVINSVNNLIGGPSISRRNVISANRVSELTLITGKWTE